MNWIQRTRIFRYILFILIRFDFSWNKLDIKSFIFFFCSIDLYIRYYNVTRIAHFRIPHRNVRNSDIDVKMCKKKKNNYICLNNTISHSKRILTNKLNESLVFFSKYWRKLVFFYYLVWNERNELEFNGFSGHDISSCIFYFRKK